jgi:hypothetical protein
MFDDFENEDLTEVIKPQTQQSGNKPSGFTPGKFPKKEIRQTPYLPVAVYIDKDFPAEIKEKLVKLIHQLLARGYTIRVNADDKNLYEQLKALGPNIEFYTPWKNFNEIESKHYYSHEIHKKIAQENFPAWDKIPDVVKSMLARNVRMILGDKLDSSMFFLLTWSEDGAVTSSECGPKTGKTSFLIKVASRYKLPVFNIGSERSVKSFERNFVLD